MLPFKLSGKTSALQSTDAGGTAGRSERCAEGRDNPPQTLFLAVIKCCQTCFALFRFRYIMTGEERPTDEARRRAQRKCALTSKCGCEEAQTSEQFEHVSDVD